ncbi:hypothetical protein ASG89_20840 [Paenibacillus sp. Soil766]|uniref:LuxR C-terminal-related transcriptional regulator n=1 Tax=Paenibacillus sp. Soil766 TaxID=1736404 RepID=UPI00070F8C68|nr:LuxR C-terminal-related transcriptional regulator [Paenibacillus sp. Soil766]KRF05573.1 hypothetical protein ASG89_20840 [Paenibacillus sp. Soil766]
MNTTPDHILLKTKISIPVTRESLVKRNRLMSVITKGLQGRLTAVCAPAGYGKTTLLSQWVRESGGLCAWVSLDEMDNDPVRFWRYTAQALSGSLPAESLTRISSLAQALPAVSIHMFLDSMINELCILSEPLALILDDYHVITDMRVHDSLSYFIDYLPNNVHVLLASRAELPFPTSKWMARDERTDINALHLQFTIDETESFYQETIEQLLSNRQILKMLDRTEGWVTGLQLVAFAIRSHPNHDHYIEQFKGYNRNVSDYLFEEVFSKLSDDFKHFLLHTSVLDRMDAWICNIVSERTNSDQMLEQLKALNLFLIPLDDHGIWFRYHHLFSEFLRSMLKRNDLAKWVQVNQLASQCFAERGLMDEAIDHAIAAGDFPLADRLLEQHIPDVLQRGEFTTLLRWFECAPLEMPRSPEMSLFYAFILTVTNQADRAELQLRHIGLQVDAVDCTERRMHLQSGMLFLRSNLLFFTGNYEEWQQFADSITGSMLPDNGVFYNFNYNMTEPLVKRTALGLKGALSSAVEMVGIRFTHVLESHGWNNALINLYVKQSMCEGYYEWNRLDDCRALLHQVGKAAGTNQTPGLFVPHRIMQTRLYMTEGHFQLAHECINEAIEEGAAKLFEHRWLLFLRAFKIEIYLLEGRVAQAKTEIAALQISPKDTPTFNKEFEYLTLVRLLSRQHKYSEALRLLERLKPQSVRECLLSSLVEISLLQARIEHQQGQQAAALRCLHEALLIGEENGYIRSFLDEGSVIEELLHMYLNNQRNPNSPSSERKGVSAAYVHKLIELFPQREGREAVSSASRLIEPLSQSELIMLNLIRKGASNKQIAEEMALSVGTVRVYLSRIYAKLGVSSRTQAWSIAQKLEILG